MDGPETPPTVVSRFAAHDRRAGRIADHGEQARAVRPGHRVVLELPAPGVGDDGARAAVARVLVGGVVREPQPPDDRAVRPRRREVQRNVPRRRFHLDAGRIVTEVQRSRGRLGADLDRAAGRRGRGGNRPERSRTTTPCRRRTATPRCTSVTPTTTLPEPRPPAPRPSRRSLTRASARRRRPTTRDDDGSSPRALRTCVADRRERGRGRAQVWPCDGGARSWWRCGYSGASDAR